MLGDKGRSTSIKEKKTGPIQGLEIIFFFLLQVTMESNGFKMLKESDFQSRMLHPNYQTSIKVK